MHNHLRPFLLLCSASVALAGCSHGGTGSSERRLDTFDNVRALRNYTIYNTPEAWSLLGGYLKGSPAAVQSVVIRNGATIANGYVETETETEQVGDGGLVLRFVSSGNYYLLAIRDDSVLGHANLEMYVAAGGSFTTIAGPVNLNFPAGTRKSVRFEASGTSLRGYVDDTLVLQAADARYSSGGFGLRHDNTRRFGSLESRFDLLRWGTL